MNDHERPWGLTAREWADEGSTLVEDHDPDTWDAETPDDLARVMARRRLEVIA